MKKSTLRKKRKLAAVQTAALGKVKRAHAQKKDAYLNGDITYLIKRKSHFIRRDVSY